MVNVTKDIAGLFNLDGEVYNAKFNATTGVLELERTSGRPMNPEQQQAMGSKPTPKPAEGRTTPGGGGRGHTDSDEKTLPDEMTSLKIAIERVLKQNRLTKLEHNRLKGKLDLKSRALTKSQAGSQSIRTRKGKEDAFGYNVLLLVDNSGSMQRGDGRMTRITLANNVTQNLHKVLKATDGINMKVLAFTDAMKDVAGWTDTSAKQMSAGGGNCDAAACYVALTEGFRDNPNPEYRNILLVLSDGEPCSGRLGRRDLPQLDVFRDNDSADIARFVQRTARQTGIYVAGLGIQHDSTQIPNSRKIDKLEEVQKALVSVLKGAIDHE